MSAYFLKRYFRGKNNINMTKWVVVMSGTLQI